MFIDSSGYCTECQWNPCQCPSFEELRLREMEAKIKKLERKIAKKKSGKIVKTNQGGHK
jgi:hypothetical protein